MLADMSYSYPPNHPMPMYNVNPDPIYQPNPVPVYQPSYPPQMEYNPQYQQNQPPQQHYMGYSNSFESQYEFDYQQQQNHHQQQQQPYQHPSQQQTYQQQQQLFLGQMASNISSETLAATALQYGPTLAATGKEFIDQKLDSFTAKSKGVYKSYWDVDTNYVLRKLAYLLIPFPPRGSESNGFSSYSPSASESRSLNSPDLYIPSMSFVTYILMVGYVLGSQGRFAPELLGITATSALVWLTLELGVSLVAMYLTGMYSSGLWHRLSVLSGYKFFYMVCCIGVFGIIGAYGYYFSFLLTALSSFFFTICSLRNVISDENQFHSANKFYLNFFIALVQPVMVYWLTWHLVHYSQ